MALTIRLIDGQKAHIEHTVGLVEDEVRQAVEIDQALIHKIDQAAGRRDNDICTAPRRPSGVCNRLRR